MLELVEGGSLSGFVTEETDAYVVKKGIEAKFSRPAPYGGPNDKPDVAGTSGVEKVRDSMRIMLGDMPASD